MSIRYGQKYSFIEKWLVVLLCCGLYIISDKMENAKIYNLYRIILCLFLVIQIMSNRKISLTDDVIWKWIFIIYAGISLSWSLVREQDAAFKNIALNFVLYILLAFYLSNKNRLEYIICGFAISGIVLSLYFLFKADMTAGRALLPGFNVNDIAQKEFFSVFMLLWLYQDKKSKRLLLGVIICLAPMVLSGSKKIILDVVIAIFVYAIYYKKSYKKFLTLSLSVILVIIGYVLLINNQVLYSIIGHRLQGMLMGFFQTGSYDASDSLRLYLIKTGLDYWKDSPLFGIGLANFEFLNIYGLYAHNNYIEILCNLGLVGLLIYYIMYIKYFFAIAKYAKWSTFKHYIVMALFCVIIFNDFALESYYSLFEQIRFLLLCSVIRKGLPDVLHVKCKSFRVWAENS